MARVKRKSKVTAKQKSARRRNIKLAQAAKKKGGVGGKKSLSEMKKPVSKIRLKSTMKLERKESRKIVKMMRAFRGV